MRHILKSVVVSICYKFCPRENMVCYCLTEKIGGQSLIITKEDFRDELNVCLYGGEVVDIPNGDFVQKVADLGDQLEKSLGDVLDNLSNLVLTESDSMVFFEKTRRPFN
jgi:hypothetical protein